MNFSDALLIFWIIALKICHASNKNTKKQREAERLSQSIETSNRLSSHAWQQQDTLEKFIFTTLKVDRKTLNNMNIIALTLACTIVMQSSFCSLVKSSFSVPHSSVMIPLSVTKRMPTVCTLEPFDDLDLVDQKETTEMAAVQARLPQLPPAQEPIHDWSAGTTKRDGDIAGLAPAKRTATRLQPNMSSSTSKYTYIDEEYIPSPEETCVVHYLGTTRQINHRLIDYLLLTTVESRMATKKDYINAF